MTRHFRQFAIGTFAAVGIGLVAGAFVPHAQADAWDKKTIVTVNEPIIAGNKVLDPGTYVWKLMDSPSDRHILQIFDKDQQHLETTVLTIPNYRVNPSDKVQFAFYETPAGVPRAVHTWWYPGMNTGEDLPYPRKLVAELAAAAPAPAPMTAPEPAPTPAAPAAAPEPQPEPQPAAPAPEPAPAPEQTQAAPAPAAPAEPAALPHTASFNPLIGLFGVMSLSLAGLLTIASKKA
jgi:pyruvate/2-oxoglutarate dehydrogenase complex dihydrolipoamide acyltransferase (E2) component